MTPDEKALLLTVARVLRAQIADNIPISGRMPKTRDDNLEDVACLNEVLKPFDPIDAGPINECEPDRQAKIESARLRDE